MTDFAGVPDPMRVCPQWLVWQQRLVPERNKMTKVPLSVRTGLVADAHAPATWTTFDHAVAYLDHFKRPDLGLGFALGHGSGLAGIDLDGVFSADGAHVLKPKFCELAQRFQTYTEVSPSRTGLHVIMRAEVPSGRRTAEGIELYGTGRYFTVTGQPYFNLPIEARQEYANALVADIDATRAKQAADTQLDWSAPDSMADDALLYMAANAANGARFTDLWHGNFAHLYPGNDPRGDHSRADFALIDILAFYTDSPTQVVRLFLQSALGRREKAQQRLVDYVYPMVKRSFDNKVPLIKLSLQPKQPTIAPVPTKVTQEYITEKQQPDIEDEERAAIHEDVFTPPPGLVGSIASYIYGQAKWPLPEIAVMGAFGLLAGIVGRQWQFQDQGLNLFLMVLAETGAGKDAASQGIGKIMDAVCEPTLEDRLATPSTTNLAQGFPAARDFIGPSVLTGQGVMRMFNQSRTLSCVSILTEFSRTMQELASKTAHQGSRDFNRVLLEFYSKSTQGARFLGSMNADKAKDVKPINSPSYSMFCEGTPEKFYEALNETLVTDGMLNRFIVVEHVGYGPHNPGHVEASKVPQHLKDSITALCAMVLKLQTEGDVRIQVQSTPDAAAYADQLMHAYRQRGIGTTTETGRQLWMRVHQNLIRLAAIIAIGINPTQPVVTYDHIEYANRLLYRQTLLLIGKFRRGEVGTRENDDRTMYGEMMRFVDDWYAYTEANLPKAYGMYRDVRAAGGVPLYYLTMRAQQSKFFKDPRSGKTKHNVTDTVQGLVDSGKLALVAVEGHRTAKIYRRV